MSSPTQRTIAELKKRGYMTAITERWNPYAHIRQDLYGIIDVLAVSPSLGTLGVQTTSTSNLSARVKKCRESAEVGILLAAGWHIECWGWSKKGERGRRKVWTLREVDMAETIRRTQGQARPSCAK